MAIRTISYGQLAALLTGLGFERRVLDEHRVGYRHPPTGSFLMLPNSPPDTPARESDYFHVRSLLDWQGLMERKEFDARFATPAVASV